MPRKKKEVQAPPSEPVIAASISEVVATAVAVEDTNTEVPAAPIVQGKRVFEYKRLSASMMKTWLLCKRKFHLQYVDGIKSPPNTSFTLGTAVHEALEMANISLKENMRQLNPMEIDYYVQVFRDAAAKAHITDMELFETGEEVVRSELSSYNLNEEIIGVELEFDLVTPEGVRIYGFIDKLTKVNDTTIKISDYKTSINPISYEEAKTDPQLSMYDLAISMMFPEYNNRILELRYLRPGESLTIYRNEIEQHNFRRQLLSVHRAITDYMANLNGAPAGEMNEFCNWCSYKTSCPQYVESVNTLLPDAPATFELTDSQFVELYDKVSAILKSAEAWKDSLKIWAAQRLEADPDALITNGKKEVFTVSSTRREYDVTSIGKAIGLDDLLGASTQGVPLVKLQNKNLENYLRVKGNEKLNAKVEGLVQIKFNSPQIRLKKANGKQE